MTSTLVLNQGYIIVIIVSGRLEMINAVDSLSARPMKWAVVIRSRVGINDGMQVDYDNNTAIKCIYV